MYVGFPLSRRVFNDFRFNRLFDYPTHARSRHVRLRGRPLYYKENYDFRFGRPQVDVCSTCEDLGTKFKSTALNDNEKRTAVAELMVHKRRACKFYE